jgi:GntR family transcriptional repressor for pyruvate dehydrogenase complex
MDDDKSSAELLREDVGGGFRRGRTVKRFEPIQPYRMANEIVRNLSNMILDGDIPPDTRLPGERELADQFDVSRPTLREALHVLEALGLVEVHPGGGTYVSKKPTALPPRLLGRLLLRDERLVVELIETRHEFESRNAELAAKNGTSADFLRIEKCLKVMSTAVRAGRDEFKPDIDFHLSIAEATRNRVRLFITTSMLLAHSEMLHEVRRRMVRRKKEVTKDFLQEHGTIYRAIKERRSGQAREAMRIHLDGAFMRNQVSL